MKRDKPEGTDGLVRFMRDLARPGRWQGRWLIKKDTGFPVEKPIDGGDVFANKYRPRTQLAHGNR